MAFGWICQAVAEKARATPKSVLGGETRWASSCLVWLKTRLQFCRKAALGAMHTNCISICLRWLCVNTSNTPMYAPATRRVSFKCEANRKEPTALLFVICLPKPLWLWEQGPQLEERQQKRCPEYSKKTSFVWTASYSGQTKETGLWGISLWCSTAPLNHWMNLCERQRTQVHFLARPHYSVCTFL